MTPVEFALSAKAQQLRALLHWGTYPVERGAYLLSHYRARQTPFTVLQCHAMTTRKVSTFRIEEELLEGLREVFDRDGVSVPEQVRRAIRQWLEQRGVPVKKSASKRVAPWKARQSR